MRIIAGLYRGRRLKTTTGPGFRPAMGKVREAVFSMLEARGLAWPLVRVLDLFAGSGSLGFEALSRGAGAAVFVESAPTAAEVIAKNTEILGLEADRSVIWQEDVGKALNRRPGRPFSVIFIDPPYQERLLDRTLDSLLRNGWLAPGAIVNAEVESRASFRADRPGLLALADRSYGQTRVLLWTTDGQAA
ncbi:MAG: 16S rRNA (guanine(966)-N(2))-methyltransferase RsmD [Deltaproteobacteria bacterium]|jgi:16S rRNA (guanine966-N2)-methyltransferase|nr:16S rRNA (guanine(966)-N(2))-methyltransferase RsmD [Deltaproteobacteria bacterium]